MRRTPQFCTTWSLFAMIVSWQGSCRHSYIHSPERGRRTLPRAPLFLSPRTGGSLGHQGHFQPPPKSQAGPCLPVATCPRPCERDPLSRGKLFRHASERVHFTTHLTIVWT